MEHALLHMDTVEMSALDREEAYCPKREDEVNLWLRERSGHEKFHAGFERLKPIFHQFVDAFKTQNIKIATIGGTNGKGETALRLGGYLVASEASCATWMSPHVLSLRERFLFQNRPVSYSRLEEAVHQCRHLIPTLSFYEFHFYVFCHLALKQSTLDFLVLEVGMGGRLDAVNLFDADVCALTSISRDHCEYLGDTPEAILKEKLGISRKNRPLLTSLESPSLRDHCHHHAHKEGVPWRDIFEKKKNYRQRNDLMAQELCQALTGIRPTPQPLNPLKGRWEKMTHLANTLLFVGAHNQDGFKKMAESLPDQDIDKVLVSFSQRTVPEMVACLKHLKTSNIPIVLTHFDHPRGLSFADWQNLCSHPWLFSVIKIEYNWINVIIEATDSKQTILVCGSYYFLGEVQKFLWSKKSLDGGCSDLFSGEPLQRSF